MCFKGNNCVKKPILRELKEANNKNNKLNRDERITVIRISAKCFRSAQRFTLF